METVELFSRPLNRDPVFNQDDPVLCTVFLIREDYNNLQSRLF
jgi:hypothetical protein